MKSTQFYQVSLLTIIFAFALLLNSCKKEVVPELTTSSVASVTQITASSGGSIVSEGSSTILSRGVCWSISPSPDITDSKTSDGGGAGSFASAITGLKAGTTYFVRAYATNVKGTGYGMAMSFTTLQATTPGLITAEITNITGNTATCGGTVTSDGATAVTSRGICWSVTENPTILNSKTSDGAGKGSYISIVTGLNSSITYYIRAYATNLIGTSYGNSYTFTTNSLPSITTNSVSAITQTTAISGGNIIYDGGAAISAQGICWSTSLNPTTSDSKKTESPGVGNFTSNVSGLLPSTTYYLRAYATNSVGTAYGNAIIFKTLDASVTDIEGNVYKVVTIGTQTWMAENLKTIHYNDNTSIPLVADNTIWSTLSTPGYCWYNNDEATNKNKFGALYNYKALATDKLCPKNWHVPVDTEWAILINLLGGVNYAGGSMKEIGFEHWQSPNTGATNSSGFTALPGGWRQASGVFVYINVYCGWTARYIELGARNTGFRVLSSESVIVISGSLNLYVGSSVRCLKD